MSFQTLVNADGIKFKSNRMPKAPTIIVIHWGNASSFISHTNWGGSEDQEDAVLKARAERSRASKNEYTTAKNPSKRT